MGIKGIKKQRSYKAQDPSRTLLKLSQLFTDVHKRATSVFGAMCRTACNDKHTVMVRLDNRVQDQRDGRRQSRREKGDITFSLFLLVEDGVYQETTIDATANEEDSEDCDVVLHFELMDGPAKASQPVTANFTTAISLADFLRDTLQDEDARMTPKQQTLLSLDVQHPPYSCSERSGAPYPGIAQPLSFLAQKRGSPRCSSEKIPHHTRFVEHMLHATNTTTTTQTTPDLSVKETLLDLAILLQENCRAW
ncbi:hypothetical protein B0H66DRAFT_622032 [Apodospora peruviana]|uniref:Uncharacterized protein n=1 Tax=Apodospora peruviana TaxID=516989 RepID=A0AAE0I421_9PEZI|nr:hypothetical protein B0H66DRAFT_622032 [Apodospora peruviana]